MRCVVKSVITMKTNSELVKEECLVLFNRMFKDATLTFFGEDGNGKYGRSVFPVTAKVAAVDFYFDAYSDDYSEIVAYLVITLDGYDARVTGHCMTDVNLRINLDRLLSAWHTEPAALDWADVSLQHDHSITLKVDVEKLLLW